jgi:hypothetical protein
MVTEAENPLARCNSHFVTSDLRKFAEQQGPVIGWNESNRAYILTHGVRGIEWSNYRHPLPQHVYNVYITCWADMWLVCEGTCVDYALTKKAKQTC